MMIKAHIKDHISTSLACYLSLTLFFSLMLYFYNPYNFFANILMFAAGILSWTFAEYLIHRFICHINHYLPSLKRVYHSLHGKRHQDVLHRASRITTIFHSGNLLLLTSVLVKFQPDLLSFCFLNGVIFGYILYLLVYYRAHKRPVNFLLKRMWQHHVLHHKYFPDKAFGVTTPLWDIIFRTMPQTRQKSE